MDTAPLPPLPSACLARLRQFLHPARPQAARPGGPARRRQVDLGRGLATVVGGRRAGRADGRLSPANVELQRLGRAGRKGAPDTFDAAGYAALLQRLRTQRADETVYAPEFRREIEEPVAGAIAVLPQTRLIITEGNYLLLDHGPWAGVAPLLDEVWYVEVDDGLRNQRLVRRHEQFGRSAQDARDWVRGTDEPNAQLIAATRSRAHWVCGWG